ncbi:MAG: lipase family protein [Veillonellaceae bacterium]|jgi:hypothetical protein|nr:lipase family protein [Veillonellaceae bacterium]
MKHLFKLLLLSILILASAPATGYAGPLEAYDEAYELSITSGASMASYHDRAGELATRYLEQDGWQIAHYVQPHNKAGARFLVAKKDGLLGKTVYIVAIVGTENLNDMKFNLKADKVYFGGSTFEEFAANAALKNISTDQPQVHKGFNEFTQSGLTAKLSDSSGPSLRFTDLLNSDNDYILYLTGHSLGGAAATIAGARLIDIGIPPDKLKVITFGAPAVGNPAFAAKYQPILDLTRVVISGDPVTGVLQTLAGGYKQFGREIKWELPATTHDDPHKLTSYVDLALKNYYDERKKALLAGAELAKPRISKEAITEPVYIAPLKNNLPPALKNEYRYMSEALRDETRRIIPNFVTADKNSDDWRENALAAGCRWAIVPEVSALQVKQERHTYYITLTQTIYDVSTGTATDLTIYSTGTYNLTPLEAFIHAFKGSSSALVDALRRTSTNPDI